MTIHTIVILALTWLLPTQDKDVEKDKKPATSTSKNPSPAKPTPSKEIQQAVDRIKADMDVKEAESILKPFILESCHLPMGETGRYERLYHLKGNFEVEILFAPYPKLDKVESVGEIEPKSKWRGEWNPSPKEAASAWEIANKQIVADGALNISPSKKYHRNPAGMLYSTEQTPLTVQVHDPLHGHSELSVRWHGRYQTHRLVILDVLRKDDWLYEIVVDAEDKKVVELTWTPTAVQIADARKICDQKMKKWLGKLSPSDPKIEVKAHGRYDFGPTRRLLSLTYSRPYQMEVDGKPEGFGGPGSTFLSFITIDIETGKAEEEE